MAEWDTCGVKEIERYLKNSVRAESVGKTNMAIERA
jgi:hypothetical protein